jgi:hypothetical protein
MAISYTSDSNRSVQVYEGQGRQVCRQSVVFNVASNPAANDQFRVMRLPKCRVVGGMISGRKLDTNASETLKLDVGTISDFVYDANGNPAGGTLNQTTLHKSGVITGAGVTDHVESDGASLFVRHFNKVIDGDLVLTGDDNLVVVTAAATAATFAAGNIRVDVDYVCDDQ